MQLRSAVDFDTVDALTDHLQQSLGHIRSFFYNPQHIHNSLYTTIQPQSESIFRAITKSTGISYPETITLGFMAHTLLMQFDLEYTTTRKSILSELTHLPTNPLCALGLTPTNYNLLPNSALSAILQDLRTPILPKLGNEVTLAQPVDVGGVALRVIPTLSTI